MVVQTMAPAHEHHDIARLSGWKLEAARIAWLVAIFLNVIHYFAGLPRVWQIATTLSDASLERLAVLGFPPNFPAIYLIVLDSITFTLYMTAAIILFQRKSDERLALIASIMLVFTAMLYTAPGYEARTPIWLIASGAAVAETAQVAFLLIFPTGRFSPKWTRWFVAPLFVWRLYVWYVHYIPGLYTTVRTGDNYPFLKQNGLDVLVLFLLVLAAVGLQVRRYRREPDAEQRQQAKWMIWGMAMAVVIVGVYVFVLNIAPMQHSNPGSAVIMRLAGRTVRQLALCMIPLSMLYSILRYRLWDIDFLINRTLVYLPLTSLLAGLFAVVLTLSQRFFVATTGQKSDFAIVLTTLFLTSVVTPIRTELQAVVDRRFKEAPDPFRALEGLDKQVSDMADVVSPQRALRRLLAESVKAFGAEGGAVYMEGSDGPRLIESSDGWLGPIKLQLMLAVSGSPVGWLALGKRRSGQGYSAEEVERLSQTMDRVAELLALLAAHHDHRGDDKASLARDGVPAALPLPAPPVPLS